MSSQEEKKLRVTDDPKYFTRKKREWRKKNPIHYCVEMNGKMYAFTKDKIIKKIRSPIQFTKDIIRL